MIARNYCALCGSPGRFVYRGLTDRLFGAAGQWNVVRCRGASCGMLWLNPSPEAEELKAAYQQYYTHAASTRIRGGWAKSVLTAMEQSYWAAQYGYGEAGRKEGRWLSYALRGLPLRRRAADGAVRHLRAQAQGRLLDVGCGSGEWMQAMERRGWTTCGVDFDERAVAVGRQAGLDIRTGTVEAQDYSDGSFDAITLHHVIEHLPDPAATLAECRRILKPGGQLAIYTPNGRSLSHAWFGADWRGLEPPRHLQVFSPDALRALLVAAGFERVVIRPIIANSVIRESLRLAHGDYHRAPGWARQRLNRALAAGFNLLELALVPWFPGMADCINGAGSKPAGSK